MKVRETYVEILSEAYYPHADLWKYRHICPGNFVVYCGTCLLPRFYCQYFFLPPNAAEKKEPHPLREKGPLSGRRVRSYYGD